MAVIHNIRNTTTFNMCVCIWVSVTKAMQEIRVYEILADISGNCNIPGMKIPSIRWKKYF